MSAWKSGLAALVALAGLSTSSQAQNFATYSGSGFGNGYTGGYGNYGLPGSNPYYGGYGGTGFGPRGYSGAYYRQSPNLNTPRTYNNMGGLMNTIRQQTGRPNSYRPGSNAGTFRNGRGR